jgi:hypothetical protein
MDDINNKTPNIQTCHCEGRRREAISMNNCDSFVKNRIATSFRLERNSSQ